MSLWELNAAIDGWQEANGGDKAAKTQSLTDEEIEQLDAVIDAHYGH